MKIYELRDATGELLAFEVSNFLLGRRRACRIVAGIPGVRLLQRPRPQALREPDDFCEFELDGVAFTITEMFGDNSRYWIGPKPPRVTAETQKVRDAFEQAAVWPFSAAR